MDGACCVPDSSELERGPKGIQPTRLALAALPISAKSPDVYRMPRASIMSIASIAPTIPTNGITNQIESHTCLTACAFFIRSLREPKNYLQPPAA